MCVWFSFKRDWQNLSVFGVWVWVFVACLCRLHEPVLSPSAPLSPVGGGKPLEGIQKLHIWQVFKLLLCNLEIWSFDRGSEQSCYSSASKRVG